VGLCSYVYVTGAKTPLTDEVLICHLWTHIAHSGDFLPNCAVLWMYRSI